MTDISIFDPTTIKPLTFSEQAVAYIKQQLAKLDDSIGFRLFVSRAGCTGLMYKVGYVVNVIPTDIVFQIDDELTVYIDEKSYPYIKGTHVSIEKKGLNEVLVYDNPNAQNNCGCGESFMVEEDLND